MDFKFIGWCKEDNHDKIWAVIRLNESNGLEKWATIWGRRGKKLQTNIAGKSNFEIEKLINSKKDKGYRRIDQSNLDKVYPEFQQDLEKTALWSLLRS